MHKLAFLTVVLAACVGGTYRGCGDPAVSDPCPGRGIEVGAPSNVNSSCVCPPARDIALGAIAGTACSPPRLECMSLGSLAATCQCSTSGTWVCPMPDFSAPELDLAEASDGGGSD